MQTTTTTLTDSDPGRLAWMLAQKAEIERDAKQCRRDEDTAEMLFFRQGALVLRARQTGVYRLDGYATPVAYVAALIGRGDRSLQRRVCIAEAFSEAEYRELLAHKLQIGRAHV